MPSRLFRRCGVGLLCLLLISWPVQAHRMELYVYVDGAVLHGEAGFVPSGAPQEGHVRIMTPDGGLLAELALSPEGTFQYQTPVRCDLRIEVETPDAHRATHTLAAEELPAGLPAWEPGMELEALAGDAPDAVHDPAAAFAQAQAPAPDAVAAIEEAIDRAVMRQSSILRNEIARIEQRIRFRDVLGGIGYIVGIAGLLAYLKFKPASPGR